MPDRGIAASGAHAQIGIVGAGISGLQLALRLQREGVSTTLYADRTPDEVRSGRLLNTVCRFAECRDRERALGVEEWDLDADGWATYGVDVSVAGPSLISFGGLFEAPASFVDFRLYLPALTEAYAARGGDLVVGPYGPADLATWAARHDLVVVAAGSRSLDGLFPRDDSRSPYREPQRRLLAALVQGIRPSDPPRLRYAIVPGVGELFQAPFLSRHGRGGNLLLEAVPGGPLEPVVTARREDDPAGFDAAVLAAVDQWMPDLADRVDRAAFAVTGPDDLLQGGVTPVVHQTAVELPGGRWAVSVGDAYVTNDPVLGQGANLASRTAEALGDAIVAGGPFDRAWCDAVGRRAWELAEPVTAWSNAVLGPPPPHAIAVFIAAGLSPTVARDLVAGFPHPQVQWGRLSSPRGRRPSWPVTGSPCPSSSRSRPLPEGRSRSGCQAAGGQAAVAAVSSAVTAALRSTRISEPMTTAAVRRNAVATANPADQPDTRASK